MVGDTFTEMINPGINSLMWYYSTNPSQCYSPNPVSGTQSEKLYQPVNQRFRGSMATTSSGIVPPTHPSGPSLRPLRSANAGDVT